MTTGLLFEIREFSLYDGPGIRTTLFLKGCPLRCLWCHNPEGLSAEPEILYAEPRCTRCGACATVCPRTEGGQTPRLCAGEQVCGACAEVCPSNARRLCGFRIEPADAVKAVLESRDLFEPARPDDERGGVTFSGGEPLMQTDFVVETAELLRREGIHTAVETCGYADPERWQRLIDAVDLVMLDLKHPDCAEHERYTGVPNTPILRNFARLAESGKEYIVRIPVVPTVNDDSVTIDAYARLLNNVPGLKQVDLLPYHASSGGKYRLLGLTPPTTFPEREIPEEFPTKIPRAKKIIS